MNFNFITERACSRALVLALLLPFIASPNAAFAQSASSPKPIQDNSFMVEEAYNQEPGVIQHISSLTRLFDRKDWVYTFTEEWPVRGLRHQLSFTTMASHAGGYPGSGFGMGDVALNYRYQLFGDGDAAIACAPRLTILVPSGRPEYGRGSGGTGFQFNIPVSVVLNKHFVMHYNTGATVVPRARDGFGNHSTTAGYNLSHSLVWLARPNFHAMLETTFQTYESVAPGNSKQLNRDLFVSPGIRWAHNFRSGLQIVPGVALPVGVGPSAGEKGLILYLSFEHPLRIFANR